jgi:soluble lytic murein transglycosylase-like protein
MIFVLGLIVSGIGGWVHRATADELKPLATPQDGLGDARVLSQQLESVRGELAVARLQLDRAEAVIEFSDRYNVSAGLTQAVYDIALAEGVEPGLAFRLVKIESRFDLRAKSIAGAVGLTQILPSTARLYEPGLTTEQIYDRDTNLRLGLRYLHDLLERYDNDLERALLAYNRGPSRVQELLAAGIDPRNGYSQSVMRGYHRPTRAE